MYTLNYHCKTTPLTLLRPVNLLLLFIVMLVIGNTTLSAQAQEGREVDQEIQQIISLIQSGINANNISQARAGLLVMNSKYLSGELSNFESYLYWDLDVQLHMKQQDYPAAAASYEKMLPHAPDDKSRTRIRTNLGNLYYRTENYSKALDYLLSLYRENRRDVQLARQIAYTYHSMGNSTQATFYARKMLDESDAPSRNDYLFLKTVYLQEEDYQSARQLNDEMIELFNHPDDVAEASYLSEMTE